MYVDDLAIASKDPLALTGSLETKYGFSLKGTGPITYHLGCDFLHDGSRVLCTQPKKYIRKMATTYERLSGTKPKDLYTSPLEKGDHPEMDTSELLNSTGIKQYQSMVGAMQWAVSIGRLDITTAVMTLSSFRVVPPSLNLGFRIPYQIFGLDYVFIPYILSHLILSISHYDVLLIIWPSSAHVVLQRCFLLVLATV